MSSASTSSTHSAVVVGSGVSATVSVGVGLGLGLGPDAAVHVDGSSTASLALPLPPPISLHDGGAPPIVITSVPFDGSSASATATAVAGAFPSHRRRSSDDRLREVSFREPLAARPLSNRGFRSIPGVPPGTISTLMRLPRNPEDAGRSGRAEPFTGLSNCIDAWVAPDVYKPAYRNPVTGRTPDSYIDARSSDTDPTHYWSEADAFRDNLVRSNAAVGPGRCRAKLQEWELDTWDTLIQWEYNAYRSNLEIYGNDGDGMCDTEIEGFIDGCDWFFDRAGRAVGGALGFGYILDPLSRALWPTLDQNKLGEKCPSLPGFMKGGEAFWKSKSGAGWLLYYPVHFLLTPFLTLAAICLRLLSIGLVFFFRGLIKLIGWCISRTIKLLYILIVYLPLNPISWCYWAWRVKDLGDRVKRLETQRLIPQRVALPGSDLDESDRSVPPSPIRVSPSNSPAASPRLASSVATSALVSGVPHDIRRTAQDASRSVDATSSALGRPISDRTALHAAVHYTRTANRERGRGGAAAAAAARSEKAGRDARTDSSIHKSDLG